MKKQEQLRQIKEQTLAAAERQNRQKQQEKDQQRQLQTQQLQMQQHPEIPLQPQQSLQQITPQPAQLQQIRCSISNCHYWAEGNNCSAKQVLVTSQTMAKGLNPATDAPMASQLAMTPISGVIESCCNTFAPGGSYSAFQDGVTKL